MYCALFPANAVVPKELSEVDGAAGAVVVVVVVVEGPSRLHSCRNRAIHPTRNDTPWHERNASNATQRNAMRRGGTFRCAHRQTGGAPGEGGGERVRRTAFP